MSGEGSESPENARASGETYPFCAAHERLLATPPNAELARRPCGKHTNLRFRSTLTDIFQSLKWTAPSPQFVRTSEKKSERPGIGRAHSPTRLLFLFLFSLKSSFLIFLCLESMEQAILRMDKFLRKRLNSYEFTSVQCTDSNGGSLS